MALHMDSQAKGGCLLVVVFAAVVCSVVGVALYHSSGAREQNRPAQRQVTAPPATKMDANRPITGDVDGQAAKKEREKLEPEDDAERVMRQMREKAASKGRNRAAQGPPH